MIYTRKLVGLGRLSVSVWLNWLEMADEALFQFLHSEIIQYVNNAETGDSVRALQTLSRSNRTEWAQHTNKTSCEEVELM